MKRYSTNHIIQTTPTHPKIIPKPTLNSKEKKKKKKLLQQNVPVITLQILHHLSSYCTCNDRDIRIKQISIYHFSPTTNLLFLNLHDLRLPCSSQNEPSCSSGGVFSGSTTSSPSSGSRWEPKDSSRGEGLVEMGE